MDYGTTEQNFDFEITDIGGEGSIEMDEEGLIHLTLPQAKRESEELQDLEQTTQANDEISLNNKDTEGPIASVEGIKEQETASLLENTNEDETAPNPAIEDVPNKKEGILMQYINLLRRHWVLRYLFLAQAVSNFGDWLNYIACVTLIDKYTDNELYLSAYLLTRTVPVFAVGLVSGVVVDKFDRRKIMIICDLLRAAVVLLYLFVRSESMMWILFITSSVEFGLSAFFDPSYTAVLPGLLNDDPRDLILANTMSSLIWSLSTTFGSLLGGVTTSFIGENGSFIMDSGTFLLSALLAAPLLRFTLSNKNEKEMKPLLIVDEEIEQPNEIEMRTLSGQQSSLSPSLPELPAEVAEQISENPILKENIEDKGDDDDQLSFLQERVEEREEDEKNIKTSSTKHIGCAQNVKQRIGGSAGKIFNAGKVGLKMTWDGFVYFNRDKYAFFLTFIKLSSSLSFSMISQINVVVAQESYPYGDDGSLTIGFIYFLIGVATLISPFVAEAICKDSTFRVKIALVISFLITGVGTFMVAINLNMYCYFIGNFVRPLGSTLHWIYSAFLLQITVPDEVRGRAFSFDNSNFNIGYILGTLIAGAILQKYSSTLIAGLVSSFFCFFFALFWAFIFIVFRNRSAKQVKKVDEVEAELEVELFTIE